MPTPQRYLHAIHGMAVQTASMEGSLPRYTSQPDTQQHVDKTCLGKDVHRTCCQQQYQTQELKNTESTGETQILNNMT